MIIIYLLFPEVNKFESKKKTSESELTEDVDNNGSATEATIEPEAEATVKPETA